MIQMPAYFIFPVISLSPVVTIAFEVMATVPAMMANERNSSKKVLLIVGISKKIYG